MKIIFKFSSKVWLWQGIVPWHFVYVDKKISEKVFKMVKDKKIIPSGNGLIPVLVKIKKTKWQTSLLPYKKENIYLLAIKADIRKKENIFDGNLVKITFEII